MQSLLIILTSVVAAVLYGIVHDHITAHICVEYFTIGHPRLIDSDSPTALAFFWGVVATWWVGLPLGLGLSAAARAGHRPKMRVHDVVKPILTLLVVMLVLALVSGVIGYLFSKSGSMRLAEPFAAEVPPGKQIAFLAVGWAHAASYLTGILGGIVVCLQIWRKRKLAPLEPCDTTVLWTGQERG